MGMNTFDWREYDKTRHSIFKGIVFCEHCGAAMCSSGTVYKGQREKYWYLSCLNIPKRSKNHCTHGARIKYMDLLEIIKDDLNQMISLTDEEIDEITREALERSGQVNIYQNAEDNKKAIEKRLEAIDRIIMKMYNDNAVGTISDEILSQNVSVLSKESEQLNKKLTEIQNRNSKGNDIVDNYEKFFNLAKSYGHIEELDEEILRTFIEKIEIGENELPEGCHAARKNVPYIQKITIYYRFIGNIRENEDIRQIELIELEKVAV